MIVVVLGGARSGKSEVAERRITALAGPDPVTYVATARQDRAAMEAAAAARTELISRLEMREIGQGTSLSFYQ